MDFFGYSTAGKLLLKRRKFVMTKRAAGQPSTSTFDVIKTLNWFSYIKKKVTEEVIIECEYEISKLNGPSGGASKSKQGMLRTLKNKAERLNGKGNSKKDGIKFSEISAHLVSKESEVFGEKANSIDGVAKLSGKVWGRYASGLYTPSRILDDLNLVYPESKQAYTEGPNKLFKILDSNTLNEGLELTKMAFIQILKKKSEFEGNPQGCLSGELIQSSDYIEKIENIFTHNYEFITSYDRYYKLFALFEQLIEVDEDMSAEGVRNLSLRSSTYLDAGEAASLYLSLAFIAYKFLGDTIPLPMVIAKMKLLDIIEEKYGITASHWFQQNPKNLSNVIEIFIDAQNSAHYQAISFY